jgi:hypothetical protein
MAKTKTVHFPRNSQHLTRPPEVNGGFRPADRWLGLTAQAIEATLFSESCANLAVELEPPRSIAAAEAYNNIARTVDPDLGPSKEVIDIYD